MPMKPFRGLAIALPLAGLALFCAPHQAEAATCTVAATSIVFNSVDVLGGSPVAGQGTLTIKCTTTVLDIGSLGVVPICVGINAGSGGSSSGVRLLSSSAGTLKYQLYSDSARTQPWGDLGSTELGSIERIDVSVDIPVLGTSTSTVTVPIYATLMGSQTTSGQGTYTSALTLNARYGILSTALIGGCGTILGLLTQSATGSFNASATVDKNCLVTTQSVNFGTHAVLTADVKSTGQVRVTCTNTTPYSVALGVGNYTATTRRMVNSGNFVVYGLYQDAAYTKPWGTNTVSGETVSGTGTGLTQTHTVYGRVQPQSSPPAGTYTDTVVVTVTY